MTKPYSLDLRERVVARVLAGESVRSVAQTFDVAVSSVVKWSQRYRATGSAAPGKMGGHVPGKLIGETRRWLLERTAAQNFTLRGLVSELAERGVQVDYRTVWKFVHAEGLSFKKNPAGRRTGSSARRPKTDAMESPPGET